MQAIKRLLVAKTKRNDLFIKKYLKNENSNKDMGDIVMANVESKLKDKYKSHR